MLASDSQEWIKQEENYCLKKYKSANILRLIAKWISESDENIKKSLDEW